MFLFEKWLKEQILGSLNSFMALTSIVTGSFWSTDIVIQMQVFVTGVANTVLIVSLITMIANTGMEMASGSGISWPVVGKSFITGFFFANFAASICRTVFKITNMLIVTAPAVVTSNHMDNSLSFLQVGLGLADTLMGFLLAAIPMLIGQIAYVFYAISLFINLLVHSYGGLMVIPDIVNGDSSAFPTWIKTALMYALTFLIQTIFFKAGISLILNMDTSNLGIVLGPVLLIGILFVPKALGKFGYSMGFGSAMRAAGGMAMSAFYLKGMGSK